MSRTSATNSGAAAAKRPPVLLALGLAVLVGQKLYKRYEQYKFKLNREVAQKQIKSEIRYYLKEETLTFGANDAVELEKVVFDWPDYWEQNQAPSFQVVVRSLAPKLPSYKQVQNIQDTINSRLSGQFPGLNCRCRFNASMRACWRAMKWTLRLTSSKSSTTRIQTSHRRRCLKMNRKIKQKI